MNNAVSIAMCVGGGLVMYSGIKGATIASTIQSALSGNLNPAVTEQVTFPDTQSFSSSPSSAPAGAAPSGAAGKMLGFVRGAVGKPYSEDIATNPATGKEYRFGPTEYDCSGLIYAAANNAGIDLPESEAIAASEAQWFAALSGSVHYTSTSNIKTGDILFFTGAAPGPSSFGPIGHVGMAASSSQLVSAYDTASGVCYTPISQDHFVVGVRLK